MGSVSKDVVLSLGMISCTVRVESALYTQDYLTNVCIGSTDTAHDPIAVSRPLTCEHCGPIAQHTTKKAKKEGGGLVLLEDTEVAELAGNDAEYRGKVQLVPYNAADVLTKTGQAEKYYFLTTQNSPENYALLAEIIKRYPEKLFVAKYAVRTKAQIYVAQVKGDCILLQERTFVTGLKPIPTFGTPINEAFLPLAEQMVETMEADFDAATFADQYQSHLVELTRERPIIGGKRSKTGEQVTEEAVRARLLEYRQNKMTEIGSDV
jgi:non-homologous end joining protein Ku